MEQALMCPARLETLLVCSDGSPDSQGALNTALSLAQACGSKIYLLQVMEFNPEFEAQAPEWVAQREDEIHTYLQAAMARAADLDIPAQARVRRSESAYLGILEEAQKLRPDLIIMGRRGRSRLFRLMMGNVTARVISHSPYHVLAVPKEVPLQFQKLLIASDGSPNSQVAFQEALQIVRRLGSSLLALSVARSEEDLPRTQAIVAALQAEAQQAGVSLQAQVLLGRPPEMILQAAGQHHIDLIVMGALGLTSLEALLMGSTTERVIARAPCAVLVVKQQPRLG
jgi:nucleotide-binding universal stress UspA family protein